MNKSWKRLISVMLSILMIAAIAVPAFAYDEIGSGKKGLDWEKISNEFFADALRKKGITLPESEPEYADDDVVRVSIVLDAPSTIEMGYSTKGMGANEKAMQYRSELKNKQNAVAKAISEKVLGGEQLDVVWNLTLAANIISANLPYGKIAAVKNIIGVKDVVLETRYYPEEAEKVSYEPNMAVASDMTGGNFAWMVGYTGAGSKLAIIDTGLDTDHQSFDSDAFDYAIAEIEEEYGKTISLMTLEDVADVLDELHVAERYEGIEAEDLYRTSKIPFAYNYVDNSLDVTHVNDTQGEHGSHVAGIATANRYIKDENGEYVDALDTVFVQGEAPDAQIIVMKVFGKGGGAYESDYMSAIEDAIILGCDSVNLSLGTVATGLVRNETYQYVMDELEESETLVVTSGGNQYSWATYTNLGYLYSDDVNLGRTGSPGSYANSLAVASVDNDGAIGAYLEFEGEKIFYTETSGYGNEPLRTIGGKEYEFIYIDSIGDEDEFAAVADVLEGKIAICNRGGISFYEKANNAVANGAVATIIANNADGAISMNLTGYEYSAPAVSITQANGEYIKYNSEYVEDGEISYYTGKIFVSEETEAVSYGNFYKTMSDFSSWGITGNLTLKPDITAPGGNIYSVFGYNNTSSGYTGGHDQYEMMSGTSMAAPQVTGIAAVLSQYIRENGLDEKTGLTTRQLANSLLMSTAEPLLEEDSGLFYSILKQGSGLVRIDNAILARTYILMDESATACAKDGKVKAEIGETDGHFSVKFTVNNFTDEEVEGDLSAIFFTQDIFRYYVIDGYGEAVYDEDENPYITTYLDTQTTLLPFEITWMIDGDEITFSDDEELIAQYDVNGDGWWDKQDAIDLLAYITGESDALANLYLADVNDDGIINTDDAYQLLEALAGATAIVPANGSIEVEAVVDIDTEYFDEYLTDLGNYVEGFIAFSERESEDGAMGVEHTIPVVGYYGNWSEPSMFDKGTALEYYYGEEVRTPYMSYVYGEDAEYIQGFVINYGALGEYLFGGNPFENDEVYLPERNAVNGTSVMQSAQYTQIRNGGAQRVRIYADDEVVYEDIGGASYGAYYSVNDSEWHNTYTTASIGFSAEGLPDGTVVRYELTIAPEYYVAEDGSVDWDALGKGSTMTIEAVVDNSAPEIFKLDVGFDKNLNDFGFTAAALDDNYIAGIDLFYYEDGELHLLDYAPADINAAAGEEFDTFIPLDLYETDPETEEIILRYPYLYAVVYDYALNYTGYKINLNTSEYKDPELEIEADEELYIIGNNSAQINYTIMPWGIEDLDGFEIAFESSDESIVTVDDNGLVTSVGSETAEADITITASIFDSEATAECHVTVLFIDKTLNAFVWDEEGAVWASEIDINDIPNYTKLAEIHAPIDSATVNTDGKLIGITGDPNTESSFYEIGDDYSLNFIATGDLPYFDIVPAPSLGENIYLGIYASYVCVIDGNNGSYLGVFNLSSYTGGNYLVGIAYEETYDHPTYGNTDWVFLVDEAGNLYNTGFLPMNGGYSRFGVTNIGNMGYSTDAWYYNSLYFDGESLYWSKFNSAASNVDLIMVYDLYNYGIIAKLGTFEQNVWPVGGLYEAGVTLAEAAQQSHHTGEEKIASMASDETVKLIGSEDKNTQGSAFVQTYLETTLTASKDVYNGYIVIDYDPEEVELSAVPVIAYNSYNETEDGHIRIAFANKNVIEEGTALVEFSAHLLDGVTGSVIYINYKDGMSDYAYDTIVLGKIDADEPEVNDIAVDWEWSEDYDTAVAHITDGEDKLDLDADVTIDCTADCVNDGYTYYTAIVRYNDVLYTDKIVVDTEALGHSFNYEWEWTEDLSEAEFRIYCDRCGQGWGFEADVETTVHDTDCENDGYTEYVATMDFEAYREETLASIDDLKAMLQDPTYASLYDFILWFIELAEDSYNVTLDFTDEMGETVFTDTVTVDGDEAYGHAYGEPTWEWADDHSSATATFVCENCGGEVVLQANVEAEVTDPGCEEGGYTTYTATVTFDGEEYEDVVVADETDALGHDYELTWEWAEDHSSATATFTCKREGCDHEVEINATVETEVTEPTCTEGGYTTYTAKVTFNNKDYENEAVADETDPAGHVYGEPTWEWADDHSSATATFVCENCEDEQQVQATIESEVTAQSCTAGGYTTYTATVTFDGEEYTDEAVADETDALGHSYGEPVWEWAEDHSSATATFTCKREGCNDSHQITATVEADVEEHDCEDNYKITYTAKVTFGEVEYEDEYEEQKDPDGHDYELIWTWSDELDMAVATFTCTKCGDKHEIRATIEVVVTETDCETDGKTTYTATAEFEGEPYENVKVVEGEKATGHAYAFEKWVWAEDHSEAYAEFKCANCSGTHQVQATVTSETTDPGCEEDGQTVYTATVEFEGEEYEDVVTVVIDATSHAYEVEWAWTLDFSGATATFTCANCEDTFELEAEVTKEVTDDAFVFTAVVTYDGQEYSEIVTVNFADIIHGDTDGNGVIDGRDLIRLRKYLANYDYETGECDIEIGLGADFNGDGVVDGRDLIALRKFLANLEE